MTGTGGCGAVALGPVDRAAATAAIKALLRVTVADTDTIIGDLAEAALGLAEAFTGQVTIARAATETVAAARDWTRLVATPVSAITAVAGADAGGAAVVLPPTGYAIDIDAGADGWVRCTAPGVAALSVTALAGMAADWPSLPAPLRQGVAMLAAHLYAQGDAGDAPPAAVTALWRPFRRLRLADRVPA